MSVSNLFVSREEFQKSESEREIESLKSTLADVQRMLEVATRDATENARRSADFLSSSLI